MDDDRALEGVPIIDLEREGESRGIISSGHSGKTYHIGFHYEIPGTERTEIGREGLTQEEYSGVVEARREHGIVGVRLPSRVIYIEDPKELPKD